MVFSNPISQASLLSAETVQPVKLSGVDLADQTYRITSRTEDRQLKHSIRRIGILNPPVLLPKDREYRIVTGFRRIRICRQLEFSQISARILEPQTDNRTCVFIAIVDNTTQRQLNLIELSRAYQLLAGLSADEKDLTALARAMDLPHNPGWMKKVSVLCELPQPIQDGLLADTIPLAIAHELTQFNRDEAAVLGELLGHLRISLNKQRELLTLFAEIAIRDDLPILRLLQAKEISNILNAADLDRAQKYQRLRAILRQIRFPMLSKASEDFAACVKQLHLGPALQLIPPKDFEGREYKLSFSFSCRSELRALRSKIDELLHYPTLEKLLNRDATHLPG